MFPYYYPSSSYGAAFPSSSSDTEYIRALAEERAAREQYAAARRAQEEARQRAARARAARRVYTTPYNSYHDDEYDNLDLDMALDDDATAYYHPQRPFGLSGLGTQRPLGYSAMPQFSTGPQFLSNPHGMSASQRRAMLEEQRRKELLEEQRRLELLELEKERRRQEEERLRRILQEERQREEAERRKMLEEERLKKSIEEEKLRRAIEEERLRRSMLEEEAARRERERAQLRAQQSSLEPLLRALGFVPAGAESDTDRERSGRDVHSSRAPRAHTMSPRPRRPAVSPSPIRPSRSSSEQSPKAPSPAPVTTIPITSPASSLEPTPQRPQPEPARPTDLPSLSNPTAEQVAAAEKIQEAFRAHAARKDALKSIAALRERFLTAKASFTLPTTLDYEAPNAPASDGRSYITVTVAPGIALPSPSLSTEADADPFEHAPKLAYTPTNAPLHAYEEELNRILGALDAVESRGDAGVRAARRELARLVEREAERVERWRGVVWCWWTGRAAAQEESAQAGEPGLPNATPNVQEVPSEPGDKQSMEVEPVVGEPTTPEDVPTEVQPDPSPADIPLAPSDAPIPTPVDAPIPALSAPATEEPLVTPEIDIPDVEVDTCAPPVEIEVEPPSRAEPVLPDDLEIDSIVEREPLSPSPVVVFPDSVTEAEQPPTPTVSEPSCPPTPPLSHDHAESEVDTEVEMEVELEEVRTPPPADHAPLVPVVDSSGLRLQGAEKPQQPRMETQKQPSAAPLVDRSWDEFHAYDMF
ncbi:hypothetical protein C8Q78DRAFT_1079227 [Trametes maxima]|nr:hypothetical protein C8Q78DRAFT_1079227 [Trametes maxima]